MLPSLTVISRSLAALAGRTSSVYKSGRTHLRDAMPVTMGQEFGAYADAFDHDRSLVSEALKYVRLSSPSAARQSAPESTQVLSSGRWSSGS